MSVINIDGIAWNMTLRATRKMNKSNYIKITYINMEIKMDNEYKFSFNGFVYNIKQKLI
jgi:hypothetical protein